MELFVNETLKNANVHEWIAITATAKGFVRVYFLPCQPLKRYPEEVKRRGQDGSAMKLIHDPLAIYPWAASVIKKNVFPLII